MRRILVITPLLTKTEKSDIYRTSIDTIRTVIRFYILAGILLVIVGFILRLILI